MKLTKSLIACAVCVILSIALTGCEKAQSEKSSGAATAVGGMQPPGGAQGSPMGGAPMGGAPMGAPK